MKKLKVQSQNSYYKQKTAKRQVKWTILALLFLLVSFSLQAYQPLQAQVQVNTPSTSSSSSQASNQITEKDNLCAPQMQMYAVERLEDYRRFMELHFQNKSSTVSLTNDAISRYRQLQHELYSFYARYFPVQDSSQFVVGAQPGACLNIVQTTLEDAEVLLKRHALRTSGVKKTTALLEKYQAINGQLQNLSQQFSSLKAALDAFAAKLPCYVKKGACVKG